MNHRPAEDAAEISGAVLDRAIERARLTNAAVATAIGYGEHGESKIREMRAGTRPFTLVQFARATVSCPRLARALVAEMGAIVDQDEQAPPAIRATQEAALAGAELARVGLSAAMDGSIDESERAMLRAQSSRCRRALDVLDAALARPEARPS